MLLPLSYKRKNAKKFVRSTHIVASHVSILSNKSNYIYSNLVNGLSDSQLDKNRLDTFKGKTEWRRKLYTPIADESLRV